MDNIMDMVEFDTDEKVVYGESCRMVDSDDMKNDEELLFSVECDGGDARLVKIKHSSLDETIPQRKDSDKEGEYSDEEVYWM